MAGLFDAIVPFEPSDDMSALPANISQIKAIVAVLDDALPMLIQQNPSVFDGISEKLAPLDGLLSDE